METFREEHYEVERKGADGWTSLGFVYDLNQAVTANDTLTRLGRNNYRIIRCTTIREVVE